ncbi:nucleoside deaminase [Acinetobacter sp. WZC-1]|uniref:nucleoside deaminase n=1 Tax=Acinetobacter sp. WZC-1 TaxID=3459034 RepID=UPI00403D6EE5
MDNNRRQLLKMMGAAMVIPLTATTVAARPLRSASLPETEMKKHESYMKEAIKEAAKNPYYPFGAVIVHRKTGEILARGVNASGDNPILHGEIQAINDYVARNGSKGWEDVTLYTTGEPCSMCMSAMVWAGIREVIWASSIDGIRNAGIEQIDISAQEVASRSSALYQPIALIGGVLSRETDQMFMNRKRSGA